MDRLHMRAKTPSQGSRMGKNVLALTITPNRDHDLAEAHCNTPQFRGIARCDMRLLNIKSEQPFDLTIVVQTDRLRRRNARQAGHGHDLTADRDNETRSG